MALAKELTEHSLPEIGDAFAGRDHTTVLHACRQIRGLLGTDGKLHEDWEKLIRKLSELQPPPRGTIGDAVVRTWNGCGPHGDASGNGNARTSTPLVSRQQCTYCMPSSHCHHI